MNEEENIVGKHSDVEEFIRAAKGSVPATSTDTPNTSAAPHERTFRGPGRMGRPMHVDGGLCSPGCWSHYTENLLHKPNFIRRKICTELTALGWPTCSQEMGLSVHDDDLLRCLEQS